MINMYNLFMGMAGEQWVSESATRLGIHHSHHNFDSIQEYSESQSKGPDIWNHTFQIEVKHYPNSELTSQSHYDLLIGNRWLPNIDIRIVVQIKGKTVREFRTICNKNNVIFIYVENERYLESKLRYLLCRLGILKSKPKCWVHRAGNNDINDNIRSDAPLMEYGYSRPVEVIFYDGEIVDTPICEPILDRKPPNHQITQY